jgi:CHAD domain-containing protein
MPHRASPHRPFQERLDAFTHKAHRIYDGDVDALHHTRVAARRLRELLPVLGLKADTARRLNRGLKKVTRELGAVRQLDVLALLIRELARDSRYSPTALTRVSTAVEHERDAVHRRLAAKLPLAKLQRIARRLERAVKERHAKNGGRPHRESGSKQAWLWAVDARATRRAATLRAAIDAAGALYEPARLHKIRIAVKKLRYASELGLEARHRRATADIDTLKSAQDVLGRLHDLQVLITCVGGVQASLSPPNLPAFHDLESLVRALEEDCRALHARYVHDRTRLLAIADQMRGANAVDGGVSPRAVG